MEVINSFGGIENLLNLLDTDEDNVISTEEIESLARADSDFFGQNVNENLSVIDLYSIYDGVMSSQEASFSQNENTLSYEFKDGTKSKITFDENGTVSSKYLELKGLKNERTGIGFDYKTSTASESKIDAQGRVYSVKYDAPHRVNDKTVNYTYDDENNKTVIETTTPGRIVVEEVNNETGQTTKSEVLRYHSDGKISATKQGSVGDCWVLSGVNALASTQKGAQLIKDSITQNPDGSVTVTLKGVNKSYTYTPDEIGAKDYPTENLQFSSGDIDMSLIEMAITDYRMELLKNNSSPKYASLSLASSQQPIKGGYQFEALKYLTGKLAQVVFKPEDLMSSLENIKNNNNKYAVTLGFKANDESIGTGKDVVSDHSYSLSRVTEDMVYVINPWDSTKEIACPKDKFIQNCRTMSLVDLD